MIQQFRQLTLVLLLFSGAGQAQDYYSGFFGGAEFGAISYNTQITFDGVDDPAGRGGVGYGAFFGYNRVSDNFVTTGEFLINWASTPSPYTFDPAVTTFAELDLHRGASIGADIRLGYIIIHRAQMFAGIGYSINTQSVLLDGTPLDEFPEGASDKRFGSFQWSGGLAFAFSSALRFRFTFRSLSGYDLLTGDFGSVPVTAGLARFDVEPVQQQFLFALVYRFSEPRK